MQDLIPFQLNLRNCQRLLLNEKCNFILNTLKVKGTLVVFENLFLCFIVIVFVFCKCKMRVTV